MSMLQATVDLQLQLGTFKNIDLYMRGFYEIRCGVRCTTEPKLPNKIEAQICKASCARGIQVLKEPCFENAYVESSFSSIAGARCPAASKLFHIQFRDEEVDLYDAYSFKLHILVDSVQPFQSLCRTDMFVDLELYFSDEDYSPSIRSRLKLVSTRSLKVHWDPERGLHCGLPVFFDYFHLCAVNLVVHIALTGICQIYIVGGIARQNKQNSGNIWGNSNDAFSEKPPTLESVLFNNKNQSSAARRSHALLVHQQICRLLLSAYESLQTLLHFMYQLLPGIQQMQIEATDCRQRLRELMTVMQSYNSEEELLQVVNQNVSQLSADAVLLWQQFLEVVTLSFEVEGYLCRRYHQQKTKRLAEAYFFSDHGLSQLYALPDCWHEQVTQYVRNSDYYVYLPPLEMECIDLDGWPGVMPVIFEDVYSPENKVVVSPAASVEAESFDDELTALNSDRSFVYQAGFGEAVVGEGKLLHLEGVTAEEVRRQLISRSAFTNYCRPGFSSTTNVSELPTFSSQRQAALVGYRKLNTEYSNDIDSDVFNTTSMLNGSGTLGFGTLSPVCAGLESGYFRHNSSVGIVESFPNSNSCSTSISLPNFLLTGSAECFKEQIQPLTLMPVVKEDSIEELSVMHLLRLDNFAEDLEQINSKKCDSAAQNKLSDKSNSSLVQVFSDATLEHVSRKENVKIKLSTEWPTLHLFSDLSMLASTQAYLLPVSPEVRSKRARGVHLVICVHGLDGNPADLRLVRTYLELALPTERFDYLMSELNQHDTFSDLDSMRDILINEILDYISNLRLAPSYVSVIAHSMGCLLVRAALADERLLHLRPLLWTFLSLSGPHLGMLYNNSGLVNVGIWFMQKLKRKGSLQQISMKDHPDLRHTYVYRLSQASGMEHFRYVLLISSPQDRYVPYHSTRIELCRAAVRDITDQGSVYMEMLANLLQRFIRTGLTTVVRFDIHHNFGNGGGANAFIGRAAHIATLDSETLLEKFFTVSAAKYFVTPPLKSIRRKGAVSFARDVALHHN